MDAAVITRKVFATPSLRLIPKGEKRESFTRLVLAACLKVPEGATMEKFKIDAEKLWRFSKAISTGKGDIAALRSDDLKHACELLGRVAILQDLAPGFLDEMFDVLIPHFIKQHNNAMISRTAEKKADEAGFGDEFRAAVAAGKSPNQKDFILRVVEAHQAANQVNQNQAINAIADQAGRDPDSIRRMVTRSKKRHKH